MIKWFILLAVALAATHWSSARAEPTAATAPATTCVAGKDDVESFIGWAGANAVPLPADLSKADPSWKSALDTVIGNATVVALGEPTHGAHEPLAFRNHLFRVLVEQHGFTAVALETGFSESRRIEEFVAGGPGDVAQIVRNHITWGFGDFVENVELVRWMRAYNDDPSHRTKLSFYGIDLPGGYEGSMSRARIALDDALEYLKGAAPGASEPVRTAIEPYLENFAGERFAALPPEEQGRLGDAITRLGAFFDRERAALVAATSAEEYAWAQRNAAMARELWEMFRAWPSADLTEGLPPDFYRAADIRDAAMAGNVRWALENEAPGGRVLVFGHNAHIMNAPLRGGPWKVYEQPATPMGQHLRGAMTDNLLIIGTTSATLGEGLPAVPEQPTTLEQALPHLSESGYLLDLRDAKSCLPAASWLARTQTMRTNFTVEIEVAPGIAFDTLVLFGTLTPATRVSPAP